MTRLAIPDLEPLHEWFFFWHDRDLCVPSVVHINAVIADRLVLASLLMFEQRVLLVAVLIDSVGSHSEADNILCNGCNGL